MKALRELAGRNIRPTRAAFAHGRNSELREFEHFYLCPVEFGRAASAGVSSDLLEFPGTRSPRRSSPLIRSCSTRFDPTAIGRRRNATRLRARSGLRSKAKWRNYCRTARRRRKRSPRIWRLASARCRAGSPKKERPTPRLSINCGEAWRSNISRSQACRFRKSRGCWVTKDPCRFRSRRRVSGGRCRSSCSLLSCVAFPPLFGVASLLRRRTVNVVLPENLAADMAARAVSELTESRGIPESREF